MLCTRVPSLLRLFPDLTNCLDLSLARIQTESWPYAQSSRSNSFGALKTNLSSLSWTERHVSMFLRLMMVRRLVP
jgi:hypothetical protein